MNVCAYAQYMGHHYAQYKEHYAQHRLMREPGSYPLHFLSTHTHTRARAPFVRASLCLALMCVCVCVCACVCACACVCVSLCALQAQHGCALSAVGTHHHCSPQLLVRSPPRRRHILVNYPRYHTSVGRVDNTGVSIRPVVCPNHHHPHTHSHTCRPTQASPNHHRQHPYID